MMLRFVGSLATGATAEGRRPTQLGPSIMLRARFLRWLFAAFALFLLAGCSQRAFSGGVLRQGNVAFRVGPIPAHWEQLESELESDLVTVAFRDRDRLVTVGAAGRCHRDGDDIPLRALTQHLYLGFTDRKMLAEEPLEVDGRAALRTEMIASLDGVEQHLVFVVIKKNECVYDFWRIALPTRAASTESFDGFVAGFQTLEN